VSEYEWAQQPQPGADKHSFNTRNNTRNAAHRREARRQRQEVEHVQRLLECRQGLTLVHFSAQLEPCLTPENTLHTLNTPSHPLNTGYTTPILNKALKLS
jgi:hypothetical protein